MTTTPRAPGEKEKETDWVEYNAINQGCPSEILDRYRQARDLLAGTGFTIIKKYYSPIGAWKKPTCPDCEQSLVLISEHFDGGRSPEWQCWGCGMRMFSTERDEPMNDDRPDWQKR